MSLIYALLEDTFGNPLAELRKLLLSDRKDYDLLASEQMGKAQGLCWHFRIDADVKTAFRTIPLTSKEQLRGWAPTGKYVMSQTSGSTGVPFTFASTPQRTTVTKALELRNWIRLGWRPRDYAVRLRPGEAGILRSLYNRFWGIRLLNFRTAGKKDVQLLRKDPVILHGGTSAIRTLSWYAQQLGVSLEGTRCVLIGEDPADHIPELEPYFRSVHSSYGTSECPNIATECVYHTLHVNVEYYVLEEINGELVVTNLYNYATPFIRYRTGDRGKVSVVKCRCGRKTTVVSDIEGKGADFYTDPSLKQPIGYWIASKLSHEYRGEVAQFRVLVHPKRRELEVMVVPKTAQCSERLTPYLFWLRESTGWSATLTQLGELPVSRKLVEVLD